MLKRKLTSALALTAAVTTLTAFSAMAAELPTPAEADTPAHVTVTTSSEARPDGLNGDASAYYHITLKDDGTMDVKDLELLYDEDGNPYYINGDGTLSLTFTPAGDIDDPTAFNIELESDLGNVVVDSVNAE